MTAQHFEFSNRLSRIEAGQSSFRSMLFVGPEDVHNVTYRERGQSSGKKRRFGFLRQIVLIPAAFALAFVGDMAARIAIHLSGVGAPTEDTIDAFLGVEFLGAMVVSTVLGLIIGLRMQDHILLRMGGILCAMFALHNLVHMYPAEFQTLPGGWAQMVLSTTEADTLLLRGNTIAF
jgi:putative Ca2+/H+ antiporter (TMEM165/GDT1 family)